MTTDLTTIDSNSSFDDIARITGQDDTNGGPLIPRLSINRNYETDDGDRLSPGWFTVATPNGVFYASKVIFRPYINAYQYAHYDASAEKYTNRSVIFKSFREEAIDELGGLRCGKISKSNMESVSASVVEAQKAIKTFRFVYGTVTFIDAVDAKGKPGEVVDFPCVLRVRGTNFMPIDDVFKLLTKSKKPLFTHDIECSTTKQKKGDTTYWIIDYKLDLKTTLPFKTEHLQILKDFQEVIDYENNIVREKHDKALRGSKFTEASAEVVAALDADFLEDDGLNGI